ncbi:MAG: hypothetical protein M1815_004832 [Lichina confinis]|nr:MAG: hypothetical protein M1815_004832 [Lichina confinis]
MAISSLPHNSSDFLYLLFFAIHILVLLAFDLVPLYPDAVTPQALTDLQNYYIETYQDRFFADPPLWFRGFTLGEGLYQLPLSIWALLIYSVVITVTTTTCLLEMYSWDDVSQYHKKKLLGLYGPYLALAVFMGIDMHARISTRLAAREKAASGDGGGAAAPKNINKVD